MLGFGGVMQGTLWRIRCPGHDCHGHGVALSFHIAATMCISLIAIGNGLFALHLGWMLIDWLRLRVRGNRLAAEVLLEPYEGDAPNRASKEVAA